MYELDEVNQTGTPKLGRGFDDKLLVYVHYLCTIVKI